MTLKLQISLMTLNAEHIGQHRGGVLDDKGWYAQGTYKVLPWVQSVRCEPRIRRRQGTAAGELCVPQDRHARNQERPADHPGAGEVLSPLGELDRPDAPSMRHLTARFAGSAYFE
jgi:hypothetical protein